MKYVIGQFRNEAGDREFVAKVFPPYQYHQEEFKKLLEERPQLHYRVFNAAHCDYDAKNDAWTVRDRSEGFGTEANPRDAEILTKLWREGKLLES